MRDSDDVTTMFTEGAVELCRINNVPVSLSELLSKSEIEIILSQIKKNPEDYTGSEIDRLLSDFFNGRNRVSFPLSLKVMDLYRAAAINGGGAENLADFARATVELISGKDTFAKQLFYSVAGVIGDYQLALKSIRALNALTAGFREAECVASSEDRGIVRYSGHPLLSALICEQTNVFIGDGANYLGGHKSKGIETLCSRTLEGHIFGKEYASLGLEVMVEGNRIFLRDKEGAGEPMEVGKKVKVSYVDGPGISEETFLSEPFSSLDDGVSEDSSDTGYLITKDFKLDERTISTLGIDKKKIKTDDGEISMADHIHSRGWDNDIILKEGRVYNADACEFRISWENDIRISNIAKVVIAGAAATGAAGIAYSLHKTGLDLSSIGSEALKLVPAAFLWGYFTINKLMRQVKFYENEERSFENLLTQAERDRFNTQMASAEAALTRKSYLEQMRNIPIPTLQINPDSPFNIINVNPAFASLLGIENLDEVIGTSLTRYISEKATKDLVYRVLGEWSVQDVEAEVLVGGEKIPVKYNARVNLGADGGISQIDLVVRDIRHDREIERLKIEMAKDEQLSLFIKGLIHDLNNILSPIMYYASKSRQQLRGLVESLREGQKSINDIYDVAMNLADGIEADFNSIGSSADEQTPSLLLEIADKFNRYVYAQKELYASVHDIFEAAEHTSLHKPFDQDTGGIVYQLEHISNSVQRGSELIQRLMKCITKKEQIQDYKPLSLSSVLDEAVLSASKIVSRQNPLCRIESNYDSQWQILGDNQAIYTSLMNLIINASQAMPKGGTIKTSVEDVEVTGAIQAYVGKVQPGSYVVCRVKDEGTGIDPDDLRRIFEPYFTKKEKGENAGTGLGLANVSTTMENHSGYVVVKSEVDKGTVFELYLPVIDQENKKNPAAYSGKAKGRVLVVDNDEEVLRIIGDGLQANGYSVTLCNSGKDASKKVMEAIIGQQPFDLYCLDACMPGMDGPQLYDAIKRYDEKPSVLVITGHPESPETHRMMEMGAMAIMPKPFNPEQLAQKIVELRNTG